jgi:hypothetical protein
VTSEENTVSIAVPSGTHTDVVRLVTAGFVSQIGFGFEAIDDVQLAIELVLHSLPTRDGRSTVTLTSGPSGLTASLSAFDEATLREHLRGGEEGALDLLAVIQRLVDSVEIVGGTDAAIVLRKRPGADTT